MKQSQERNDERKRSFMPSLLILFTRIDNGDADWRSGQLVGKKFYYYCLPFPKNRCIITNGEARNK